MSKFSKILLTVVFIINYSCSDDISLFTEGPIEAIAWGIINPQDTIHVVRVQKTYITEVKPDIIIHHDDIYFDSVRVFLSGIRDGETIWTREMIKTDWEKDSGYFPKDEHNVFVLYGILPYILPENSDSKSQLEKLRLNIHICDIGVSSVAETCVLSPSIITVGSIENRMMSLYGDHTSSVQFYPKPYDFSCPIGYGELGFKVFITEYQNQIPQKDSIIWISNNSAGGEDGYKLNPERIFNRLLAGLRKDREISSRILDSIHLFSSTATGIFGDYWDTRINRADSDYPPFSNFDSIYGLFFCVSTGYETGFYFDQQSLDSLCYGSKWKGMKFRNY